MKKWLLRFCLWFIERYDGGRMIYVSPEVVRVLPRAIEVIAKWDEVEASGEYKRHQAYAALIDEFRDVAHARLALAIELAIEKYK